MALEYDHKTATLVKDLFELAPKSGMDPHDLRNFLDFVIQLVLVGYGGRKFYFYDNRDIKVSSEEVSLMEELFHHLNLGTVSGIFFHGGTGGQSGSLLAACPRENKFIIPSQIISKRGKIWTAKNEKEIQKALGMAVLSSGDDWANRELDRLGVSVYFGGACLFAQVVPTRDEKERDATVRNAIALCDKWSYVWNTITGGLGLDWQLTVQTAEAKKRKHWTNNKIIHTAD